MKKKILDILFKIQMPFKYQTGIQIAIRRLDTKKSRFWMFLVFESPVLRWLLHCT